MASKSTNISSKKTVAFIILAVFFVILDRFLKALSLKGFFDAPIPLIGNFFSLNFVRNYYIAFSLPFSGPILTALIGIIILILLIYWLKLFIPFFKNSTSNSLLLPLTILLLGAILNFTDRILYGFVIDYFYLKYFTIFNLADIMIVAGVIWLIIFNKPKKYAV
ncbi:MAG TPA: signal peptidase II [Candidatus Nanoarchaeia archaeon]|nr:signal peptidase II [Candidatus Nanoarchaeia archaeon]